MKKRKKRTLSVLGGIFVGIANGFFGGGGGMVCVPLLEKTLKVEKKKAHSTAILVILPLCLVSSIVYTLQVEIDWFLLGFVGIGFIIGGGLGAVLLRNLSGKFIRLLFALIVLAAGIRMVIG